METATNLPVISFPDGFDDRWDSEMTLKGYLSHVEVGLVDGRRYVVNLIDPVRLAQDLEAEAATGRPYIADPGLIVLQEITTRSITEAIHTLWREGFFELLKPLNRPDGEIPSIVESGQSASLG
jgi:hypothetical protein